MMVTLLINFPASVKPTNASAPTLLLVPGPGINKLWLLPSEKVTESANKAVWMPETYSAKRLDRRGKRKSEGAAKLLHELQSGGRRIVAVEGGRSRKAGRIPDGLIR